MSGYLFVKTLHILSSTVLFGTGLGIAFFFLRAREETRAARYYAARTTVLADFLFTLPAAVLQPLTGFRWWFLLGWPAFVGLALVFFLMVLKPA